MTELTPLARKLRDARAAGAPFKQLQKEDES